MAKQDIPKWEDTEPIEVAEVPKWEDTEEVSGLKDTAEGGWKGFLHGLSGGTIDELAAIENTHQQDNDTE